MTRLRLPGSFFEISRLSFIHAPPLHFRTAALPTRPRSFSKPLLQTCSASYHPLMRGREFESHSPEPASKRRRISTSPLTRGALREEMAPTHIHPTIELTPIESTLRTLLLDVAQYIQQNGIVEEGSNELRYPETVLRFTGGWVRDKLLGVGSHDIDVGISSMTGNQFGNALKEYLDIPENLEKYKKGLPNGEINDAIVSIHKIDANPEKSKHLETVTTKIFGLDIDLVNLRKETYTDDSRNPQMEFGTAVEDALRRDATINAMFYNLNESCLEDLTEQGLEDMKKNIIRTPLEPYQTFKDDPLRVLRLIRFASRLEYSIDEEAEKAMRNKDISDALKLKISKERVGTELEKMLRGPHPLHALQFIDRIGIYSTIFANHHDQAVADTSSWSLAYNSLQQILYPEPGSLEADIDRLRAILMHRDDSAYYAWMIATFAPWTSVPIRTLPGPKGKPLPTRPVEVARDGLRCDNKNLMVLRDATLNFADIIKWKNSLLANEISGTPAEIRQQTGLRIRGWGKDWRLCMVLAILQEVMQGRDLSKVVREYNQFLAYIVDSDLESVCELKPIVNGAEIMQTLGSPPKGPWMSKATALAMEWQLLHPAGDKAAALDAIVDRRAELGL
ncbi:hypothetical protein N7481_008141 [Penicillium waksmanii]|uniref:uncharacterized protein n=1 Tax=Penicillium waksmanii TaxID=69791 RepID=UPI00254736C8|nr:uncharacterized protein N7481_008141 [Penicillium waksmanii]KAJ5980843.1 hypothetical protein N7481_008141 [Penicillium waksmanii]